MADPRMLIALAGPARSGEPNPFGSFLMMGLITVLVGKSEGSITQEQRSAIFAQSSVYP